MPPSLVDFAQQFVNLACALNVELLLREVEGVPVRSLNVANRSEGLRSGQIGLRTKVLRRRGGHLMALIRGSNI